MKKFAAIILIVLLLFSGCTQEKKVEKVESAPPIEKEEPKEAPPKAPLNETPLVEPPQEDSLLEDDLDKALADLTLIDDLNLSEELGFE